MARGIFEEQTCLKTSVHEILVEGLELIPCEQCSVMLLDENEEEARACRDKCKLFQQAISPQVNFSRIFQLTHEQKEKGEQSAEQDSPDEVVGPYIAKAEMVARTGEVRRDVGSMRT